MNFDECVAAGYRHYRAYKADRMCQKIITNTAIDKKLYAITVYEWDNRHLGKTKVGYQAEVEFYKNKDFWFTVELNSCENKTIEEVEQFFKDVFGNMQCVPDIHNNDEVDNGNH